MAKNLKPKGKKPINNGDLVLFGITIKKAKDGIPQLSEEQIAEFSYTPSTPIVNVIPETLTSKYQIRGVINKVILAIILVCVAIAGLYAGGNIFITAKNQEASDLSAEAALVQAEATTLQSYQTYKLNVSSKLSTLSEPTVSDVNMSLILSAINSSSATYDVDADTISYSQDGKGNCTIPDPFNPPSNIIGCISFSGSAYSEEDVRSFLNDLEQITNNDELVFYTGFISSFSNSEPNSDDGSATGSWEATISVTSAAYSDKYSMLTQSVDDLIAQNTDGTTTESTNNTTTDEGTE